MVINVPVSRLFGLGLAPVEDGGFAGLVFLVCRTADEPRVQLDFLRSWSSFHDLSGRYLAVVTPTPDAALIVQGPSREGVGQVVQNLRLHGDERRLQSPSGNRVRMTENPEDGSMARSAPVMPRDEGEHGSAVTRVATELQEFFGISESLLPCAVVVEPRERRVFAVGLTERITLYGLLKELKIAMEPGIARVNQARSEVARAREDLAGRRRRRWQATEPYGPADRGRIARRLREAAEGMDDDAVRLSHWLSDRLLLARPLTTDEQQQADALFALLHGRFGVLPLRERRGLLRAVRRAVDKLNSLDDVPGTPPEPCTDADLRVVDSQIRLSRERLRTREAGLRRALRNIALSPLVLSVTRGLGLEQETTRGLLTWRQCTWPVTVLAAPERRRPTISYEWA